MTDNLRACFSVSDPEIKAYFKLNMIPDISGLVADVEGEGIINTTRIDNKVLVYSTTFVFEQAIASASWVIEHNLNKRPSCTVVDTAGNVQAPNEITYNDENTMTVEFLAPFTGYAYLN